MIQNLTEYLLVSLKERGAYILCVVPVDSSLFFALIVLLQPGYKHLISMIVDEVTRQKAESAVIL